MNQNNLFTLSKTNFADVSWEKTEIAPIEAGQVLFKVDSVALTSNNISYAMLGQTMHYWDFYQALSPQPDRGIVPVWGFAQVVESQCTEITVGERFYGYWPLASYCVVQPEKIASHGFLDATPPKPSLATTYRYFQKMSGLTSSQEAFNALFRPLGTTAWLLADLLADCAEHDSVEQIVLSSASSKTALATANMFNKFRKDRAQNATLIGLTSPSNYDFVVKTGGFDEVYTYQDSDKLASKPSVYIDFSGSAELRASIHQHLLGSLKQSLMVGLCDWSAIAKQPSEEIDGVKPTIFFAPSQYETKAKQIGQQQVMMQIEQSLQDLQSFFDSLTLVESHTSEAITQRWLGLLSGKVNAQEGIMINPGST